MPQSLTRRKWLAAAALGLATTHSRVQAAVPKRPNILLLLADNWAYPHASIYGSPVPTPTFDRIAGQGALFTHAFAPNPSCSPSRSMLLTGQWSHRLGAAASLYGTLSNAHPTYTKLLAAAGYRLGLIGKGWAPGKPDGKPDGSQENPAGPTFATFAAFLQQQPAGQPFCVWFGSHDPHVPWRPDATAKPVALPVPAHLPDAAPIRQDMNDYAGEVQRFDSECGAMLQLLEQRGELDNTLVVITGDNGWQMPRGLANCYDLSLRVPLAMRWPGRVPAGTKREDFASLHDLAATFVEAAGLPVPAAMRDGKSLFRPTGRREMFVERERHANVRKGDLSYPVRGLRTEEYLYLRNLEPERWPAGDPEYYWAVGPYGDIDASRSKTFLMEAKPQPFFDLSFAKRPAEELYHLATDPGQIRNVATAAEHAKPLAELRKRVDAWMRRTGDPRAKQATDFWDKASYSGPKKEPN